MATPSELPFLRLMKVLQKQRQIAGISFADIFLNHEDDKFDLFVLF
jgi:hypothetical protein